MWVVEGHSHFQGHERRFYVFFWKALTWGRKGDSLESFFKSVSLLTLSHTALGFGLRIYGV